MQISLPTEQSTEAFGEALACGFQESSLALSIVYLVGDLGAGKTTLVRSVLRGLGHEGSVKSPTYTLVEEYDLPEYKVYHFDLYRLADPEELEFMGMRDFLNPELNKGRKVICFVEWPQRGGAMLPDANIELMMKIDGLGRNCTVELSKHREADLFTGAFTRAGVL